MSLAENKRSPFDKVPLTKIIDPCREWAKKKSVKNVVIVFTNWYLPNWQWIEMRIISTERSIYRMRWKIYEIIDTSVNDQIISFDHNLKYSNKRPKR